MIIKKESKMKKKLIISVLILITTSGLFSLQSKPTTVLSNVRVLAVLAEGWGLNTFLITDNLEQYGWSVTFTGLTKYVKPCSSANSYYKIPSYTVDSLISEIKDINSYDVILIMTATKYQSDPFKDIMESQQAKDLFCKADSLKKIIFAPCAGVRVLAAFNLISGKNVTGEIAYKSEYTNAGATYLTNDTAPLIDGNIITAVRNRYYHQEIVETISQAVIQNRTK